MSSRYWSCKRDWKVLDILHNTTTVTYECAHYISSSSEDEHSESDVEIFLVPTVFTLGTVDQFLEVNKVYVDHTIEWGHMKTIDDFNESQCIYHFRFKKLDMFEMKRALWPRLQEYLTGMIEYIQVRNGYICQFDTALLIVLFRF